MPQPRRPKVWGSQALYRDAPAGDRLHTAMRSLSAPLDAVVRSVLPGGRTLDFGCGHGLISLTLGRGDATADIVGVDVDQRKINCARQAATRGRLDERVRFTTITAEWRPQSSSYDTVIVCDVLYLLGHATARRTLIHLAAAVRPGGRLVIKEMSESPRWKNRVDRLQEHLAIRTLGYTVGDQVEPFSIEQITHQLCADGWSAATRRLDRCFPHPHALTVATKPGPLSSHS